MHLKKTKKTPRMFRMIALMLSLVLVFFTMTGMALAEEGTQKNLLPRLPVQRKRRNPRRSRKTPLSHRNPRTRLRWNRIMSWTQKSRLAGTMRRLRSPFA